jgi:hypothetical protein
VLLRSRPLAGAVLAVVTALALAGCGGGGSKSAGDDPAAASTTTTTAAPATTAAPTTTAAPAKTPQATPDQAAAAFVTAWTAGDRAGASAVADAAAVDALFAHPAVAVEQRGCNAPLSGMADCAYGIGRKGLLVVTTRGGDGGWTVSAASYEA